MNLQLVDFDCNEEPEGVACWDALAQPAPQHNTALLQEVAPVLRWAHGFDHEGPGPLENGANWDFDLQVTLLGHGGKPQVASPRFVPRTGQLSLLPEPVNTQILSLCLSLSSTPGFVQTFRNQFEQA